MKKSKGVPATLVVALAAGLGATGCGSGGYDECVDGSGRILDDSACRSGMGYAGAHYVHHVSSGGFGSSGSSGGGFFGG